MNPKRMAQVVVGIVMILAGLAFGLYIGLWWAFIGGIVQVIEAAKATPVDALHLAIGIGKIVFAGFLAEQTCRYFGCGTAGNRFMTDLKRRSEMFRIVIQEFEAVQPDPITGESVQRGASEIYTQTVTELSLPKIIAAINAKPRKARAPKVKP